MKRELIAAFVIAAACGASAEVRELAHYDLKGVHETSAPQALKDLAGASPELSRQGSPQIVADAPECRRKEYSSSLNFDGAGQCFNTAKNLVNGDNFVVEAWACAVKENDDGGNGFHSVVANGNGGTGFLIAQHGDEWAVMVGCVGAARLGDVEQGEWTHLAVVKQQGAVSGWMNGKKVCDLPNLGGGAENFSIGATSPGKEPFSGRIAEVRYASFQPGKFDPASDFLFKPSPRRVSPVKTEPEPPTPSHFLRNEFATLGLDDKGRIISITARQSGKQYCPGLHPSPVMSLHESGQANSNLVYPVSATFHDAKREIALSYANGATAIVKAAAKNGYFRFQLVSLEPRGNVDNIVWGPLHTKISGKIGDLIGVVRDDDWAIGMMGLDDNTIAGPVMDSDCYFMGYYIHSPDLEKYPVPRKYKEGQWFNIGGDGVSDTAFYSHPEDYFDYAAGTGAMVEPEFGSTVAYHSRDRNKSYTYCWSLLPGFERSKPRHMVSDPVPGVDFMGSGVAIYACPDDEGLHTIESIIKTEGLPYITYDGKWIHDPSTVRPTLFWNGPHDKAIEYAGAMGFKEIARDTGEWYPCLSNNWKIGNIPFANRPAMTYQEFTEECHKHGISHGGLHTLCVFLQGGISRDVTPVPSEHLQTICRTKLARDISATETNIVVTDLSFLAEKGTWTIPDSNYIRVGGEMMMYDGISKTAPWTLTGVRRGHASKAAEHKAGDELVKLMQNCYNGFVPDMTLLPDYADYFADLMFRNGMDIINFDGFESTVYQNHGYYAVRIFCRRLFDTYHKLTGRWPRISASNVFTGSWEYMNTCNLGGGNNMFNPITGRRGIEGKDMGNAFGNSWFAGSFGIQGWNSGWSLYDAENLAAKTIGWDASYSLSVSQAGIDATGERDEIFKAFHAWQAANAAQVFTKATKGKLCDPDYKFHIEQTGEKRFVLYQIKQEHFADNTGNEVKQVTITNREQTQPLQFALQVNAPADACNITLPDDGLIQCLQKIERNQFIICKGDCAYLADGNRKKIADLTLSRPAKLPAGESKIGIQFPGESPAKINFGLTVWISGKPETVTK